MIWFLPVLLSHPISRVLRTTLFLNQKGAASRSWDREARRHPFSFFGSSIFRLAVPLPVMFFHEHSSTVGSLLSFRPRLKHLLLGKSFSDHPVLNHTPLPHPLPPPSCSCPPQHVTHIGVTLPTHFLCVALIYLGHPGRCQAHGRCSRNTR